MHKIKNKNIPHILLKLFSVPYHAYPTDFSLINFSVTWTFLKTTRIEYQLEVQFSGTITSQKNEKEIDNFLKGLKKK